MKVIAFNGSPHKDGNTNFALETVAERLKQYGISTDMIQVGGKAIRGCISCGTCMKKGNERCAIDSDEVNGWIQQAKEADGILLGSPVYYGGVAGTMKCFLDRFFYVNFASGGYLKHKVGASVVAVRRSGGMAVFDELNHYFLNGEMVLSASNYWNIIHGLTGGEAAQDSEGVQCMEVLADNMAWLMQVIATGSGSVKEPAALEKVFTNFIR